MQTIVSIMPMELREYKPLITGGFYIPPCKDKDEIKILHVPHNRRRIPSLDERMTDLTVDVIDETVAKSIVYDLLNATLSATQDAHPGIMWLEGQISEEEVRTKYSQQLAELHATQNRWFVNLVKTADDVFARSGMHRDITDVQRVAAARLGMLDRPWVAKLEQKSARCPSCLTMVPAGAKVCFQCNRDIPEDPLASLASLENVPRAPVAEYIAPPSSNLISDGPAMFSVGPTKQ